MSPRELVELARKEERCLDQAGEVELWLDQAEYESEFDAAAWMGMGVHLGCTLVGTALGGLGGALVGFLVGAVASTAVNGPRHERQRRAFEHLGRALRDLENCLG